LAFISLLCILDKFAPLSYNGDETERTRTHPLELHESKGDTTMSTSTHHLLHPASFLPHPGKPVL